MGQQQIQVQRRPVRRAAAGHIRQGFYDSAIRAARRAAERIARKEANRGNHH
jgi:hypothetical protein